MILALTVDHIVLAKATCGQDYGFSYSMLAKDLVTLSYPKKYELVAYKGQPRTFDSEAEWSLIGVKILSSVNEGVSVFRMCVIFVVKQSAKSNVWCYLVSLCRALS